MSSAAAVVAAAVAVASRYLIVIDKGILKCNSTMRTILSLTTLFVLLRADVPAVREAVRVLRRLLHWFLGSFLTICGYMVLQARPEVNKKRIRGTHSDCAIVHGRVFVDDNGI